MIEIIIGIAGAIASVISFIIWIFKKKPKNSRKSIEKMLSKAKPNDFTYRDDDATYTYQQNFKLVLKKNWEGSRTFNEPWVRNFPDPNAKIYDLDIYYDNIRIIIESFITVDGSRYAIPIPSLPTKGLAISRWQYKLGTIINSKLPSDKDCEGVDPIKDKYKWSRFSFNAALKIAGITITRRPEHSASSP